MRFVVMMGNALKFVKEGSKVFLWYSSSYGCDHLMMSDEKCYNHQVS
jgi:hypothetical protein